MNSGKFNSDGKSELSWKEGFSRWLWVLLFGIAFAWVESAVVVYLREIYFKGSFYFPLVLEWQDKRIVADHLMYIEFGREIATILMLASVGLLAGRTGFQKFCYFIISFGIWDIFYYGWLWVMVGWPESLLTWDLLFFIPLPWVGPVISPILIAAAMVTAGTLILYLEEKGYEIAWRWYDWAVELIFALLMIVAFCWDWKNIIRLPDGVVRDGMPNPFAWWLYLPALILSVLYFAIRIGKIAVPGKTPFPETEGRSWKND